MIALNCNKSHIYIVTQISLKKIIPRDTLRNTINESRWNSKPCSHNTQEIMERDTEIRKRK